MDANEVFERVIAHGRGQSLSEISPSPTPVSGGLWFFQEGIYLQTGAEDAVIAAIWAAAEDDARVIVGYDPPAEGLADPPKDTPVPRLLTELFADESGRITYRSFIEALRAMGDSPLESAIYRGPGQRFAILEVEGSSAFSAYFPEPEVSDSESPCAVRVLLG